MFILIELEILDYNNAFQNLLQLEPDSNKIQSFLKYLPHEQPNGVCSLNFYQKIASQVHKVGNMNERLLLKNDLGNCITTEVQFTSFTSDNDLKLIFGVCRNHSPILENHSLITASVDGLSLIGGKKQHLIQNSKSKNIPDKINNNEIVEITNGERFRMLAEATPAVILQFDTGFRHIYANSKVQEFFGIPSHDFIGKTLDEVNLPLVFVDHFKKCLKKVMNTKRDFRDKFRLHNGKHVDYNLVPVLDHSNNIKSIITTIHDITSLILVEDEVREAKEKLSDAMKMAHLATWEYDLDARRMVLSSYYCDLLGIDFKYKMMKGEKLLENYVFKEDHPLIVAAYNEAIESKETDYKNYFEYRGIKRGEIVHVLASLRVIKNPLGIIIKCFGTVQDITELRKNEEELKAYRLNLERLVEERTQELQKSEAKLTDALKLVSLGTWEYDFYTQHFKIGEEVVQMISGTKGKAVEHIFPIAEFFKYLHPDDLQKLQNTTTYILHVRDPNFIDYMEYRIVRPDGEIRHLYVSLKIILNAEGRHKKHYGTIQDITNIRRVESEKERLIAISEATSDIIVIANITGGIIYLNQAGKSFFGVEKNLEVSYLNINSLQCHKSKKIMKKVGLGQAMRKGIWSGENQIYGKNCREIPVSQVIIAHKNENGGVECYSTILRDISRQKLIEQDLLYKNNELDTFVYRASHDLRGPIASLLGLHTIVKYEITDPVSLKYFEMYNQQILRLNNIIISLIEISRIKDREASKVNINFNTIIEECITSFMNLPNFANITFKFNIDPNLKFKSDFSIITTIIQNLIENSIKYSKPDVPSTVNIDIKELVTSISIKVSDNGIGIDSSIQGKIFNMFFRGTEQSMGSGLGLYILKNAVEKLKGKVILDSTLNKGTTFEIILPQ